MSHVTADEPAVVAARAEHLAAKGAVAYAAPAVHAAAPAVAHAAYAAPAAAYAAVPAVPAAPAQYGLVAHPNGGIYIIITLYKLYLISLRVCSRGAGGRACSGLCPGSAPGGPGPGWTLSSTQPTQASSHERGVEMEKILS